MVVIPQSRSRPASLVAILMGRRGAWRGGPPNGNGNQNQNQSQNQNRANIPIISGSGPPGGPRTSILDQYGLSSQLVEV